MLTKSSYLKYAHCPKAFWLDTFEPERAAPPDQSAQRRLRIGQRIDLKARELYADGTLIPYRPHPEEMAPLTQQAIHNGATTLFQATFHVDDLLVKVDILTKDGDEWHLIEVKSSTGYKKNEHLPDIGFQLYVLRQVGINITKASIMHLDKSCCFPDLTNLLALTDVTDEAVAYQPIVAEHILAIRPFLKQQSENLNISIGRHCKKPRRCSFYEHCWQGIIEPTIYDIPYLRREQEEELEAAQIQHVRDIPKAFAPKDKRSASYVELMREQQRSIDTNMIQSELAKLTYPLYFFDFETIDYAVPAFDGCKPYQQLPFQYSCHVLEAEGSTLEHRDYLHKETDDPRLALIEALLDHIGERGSIIVYSATFERTRLRELAEAFPQHAPRLLNIAERLWDQLNIFKKYYSDYRFGGSNSLKSVLPVMVPTLSYDALAVQNGIQAQVVWEEMIHEENEQIKEKKFQQLRKYCHLDTLAMVEIHDALKQL